MHIHIIELIVSKAHMMRICVTVEGTLIFGHYEWTITEFFLGIPIQESYILAASSSQVGANIPRFICYS